MSTFKFSTGNPYIEGKIEHSYTRTATGYTVKYSVQMRRTNSWTGDTTRGNLTYMVYINDSVVNTGTKWFKVVNGGDWCELVNGSYTVSLSASKSTTYTVGFSSSTTDGISAFKNSYKKSNVDNSPTVPVAMTNVGAPKVELVDTGKNSFVMTCTTGSDGVANPAKNSYIIYTTDGSTPDINKGGGVSVVATEKTAGKSHSITVQIESPTTVKMYGRTIGSNPEPYSYNDSKVVSKNILHYAPPVWGPNPVSLTYNTPTPTPSTIFTVKWNTPTDGNANSPLVGYICRILRNREPVLEKHLGKEVTSFTFSSDKNTTYNIPVTVGDNIVVTVTPYIYYGDGKTRLEGTKIERPEGGLIAKSPGLIRFKQSHNQWGEGQVYVKVSQTEWKKSNGVYVKTESGWRDSI